MTDAVVFTIKGLTETDVLCRYTPGKEAARRFWDEPGGHDFAAGYALPYTEFNRAQLGFEPGDNKQIQSAVRHASGNFPGGDLESRVGWSWLVERVDHRGWKVVGERAPGAVGRMLASERAVTNGEPGVEGTAFS